MNTADSWLFCPIKAGKSRLGLPNYGMCLMVMATLKVMGNDAFDGRGSTSDKHGKRTTEKSSCEWVG